jgi:hypothetical protein
MYVAMILSSLTLIMTKISVLLLFLDIFVVTWVRKATYIVMGMVVLYGLWLVASTIVHCIPVYSFWDIFVPERKCFNFSAKWTADAAVKPLVAKVCPHLLESAPASGLSGNCPNPPTISSAPSRTQGSKMC